MRLAWIALADGTPAPQGGGGCHGFRNRERPPSASGSKSSRPRPGDRCRCGSVTPSSKPTNPCWTTRSSGPSTRWRLSPLVRRETFPIGWAMGAIEYGRFSCLSPGRHHCQQGRGQPCPRPRIVAPVAVLPRLLGAETPRLTPFERRLPGVGRLPLDRNRLPATITVFGEGTKYPGRRIAEATSVPLNDLFQALSDPTRREILRLLRSAT